MKQRTEQYFMHGGKRYKRIIEHYTGMKDSIRWEIRNDETDTYDPVSWYADAPTQGELENTLVLSSH